MVAERFGAKFEEIVAEPDVVIDLMRNTVGKIVRAPVQRELTLFEGIRELALRSEGETNLLIDLIAPTLIELPGPASEGGRDTIGRIRLWADDPDAFLAAANEYV